MPRKNKNHPMISGTKQGAKSKELTAVGGMIPRRVP
jgi:hypothetical protein